MVERTIAPVSFTLILTVTELLLLRMRKMFCFTAAQAGANMFGGNDWQSAKRLS